MISLLILVVLLAVAAKVFLGMALEVVGALLALFIVLIVYFFRRKRK